MPLAHITKRLLIAIALLLSHWALAQPVETLWQQAEQLYNLEEPSTTTDAKASGLYLRIAQQLHSVQPVPKLRIHSLIKAGNIEQTYDRHTQARKYYRQAIDINRKPIADSLLLYEAYLYIGSSFYLNDVIDSAKHFFESAYGLALHLPEKKLPDQQRLYNSLGAIYYLSGNYAQAVNYFQNALRFVQRNSLDYVYDYVSIVSNIATCRQEMKAYDSAIALYKQLLPLHMRQEVIMQNLARTYYRSGKLEEAKRLYESIAFEDPQLHMKALNDLGRISEMQQQWKKAERYYDSALALNRKHFKTAKNKERGLSYYYKAQLAQQQGLYDEGLFWCNRSLESLYWQFKASGIEDLPDSLATSLAPMLSFEVLTLKASLFRQKYLAYKQPKQLEAAVRTYRTAFLEAHFIKRNFDNDEARIFFNVNYQPLYHAAIAAAFDASQTNAAYIDDYLFFVETYKGSLLANNLQQQAARLQAGLQPALLAEEKRLKDLIAIYATRLGNAADKNNQLLQQRYAALQVELSRLQQRLMPTLSAGYYRYQQADQLTLTSIQKALPKGRAIISYYASDRFFYALAITHNKHRLLAIPHTAQLQQQLVLFLQSLRQQQQGQRFTGNAYAFALQQQLIAALMPTIGHCSEWQLLPDAALSLLPFDALSTDPQKPSYLVHKHAITYHYSLLLMLQSAGTATQTTAIAFAPFAQVNAGGFATLPYSASEVAAVGGKVLLNDKANRNVFMQSANRYGLIHLATHASVGEQNALGWIAFGPNENSNKVFLPELYNLNLHATDLVVLSACETGKGNALAGEGVMSLGRAFLYAGANNVAATLWKADDRITALLMQQFYAYRKRGIPIHKALQLSKQDLLKNDSISPVFKSPHYWANFVLIGPAAATAPATNPWYWYAGIAGLLLLIALAVYQKRRTFRHGA
ncbi:CHAT domain-containing protein [Phnomibacter sp. MR]|uniref:CHAT domain-containing protein n=1 Tax=Phnomibacter sp. MR TaxID=3042318 RepID=UPI003A805219